MTSTEIIQRKLNELGFSCPVTGVVGTTSNTGDATRQAIKNFKRSTGLGSDIYINKDFLLKLDALHKTRVPNSTYPASYFKGWNLALNISDSSPSGANIPVIDDRTAPSGDVSPSTDIIIDESKDENMMLYVGGAVALLGVLFLMKNKKKGRRK